MTVAAIKDGLTGKAWPYLAEGLTHCATCHTPRGILMGEISGEALAGASLGTWFAPNITSDPQAGIGGWSHEALTSYLARGDSGQGSQAGGADARGG